MRHPEGVSVARPPRIDPRGPNRGANGRGGQKWLWNPTRCAVYARDSFRCVYAVECDGGTPSTLIVEHVVPRAHGGTNEADNLVTSCCACNNAKGDRSVDAWCTALEVSRGAEFAAALRQRVARQTFLPLDRGLGQAIESQRPRGPFARAVDVWRRLTSSGTTSSAA